MIGEAVRLALRDEAYAVDWVKNADAAWLALRTGEYQALLLDLALPGGDGLAVLQRLRREGRKVPVIIISAREALADRVKGLDLGADDYLAKPFDVPELLARLRAVIRRQGGQAGEVLTNGRIALDPATRVARSSEAEHTLSTREFALLRALLLRPGAILSRAELESRIYTDGEEVESNAVDFLIHGLRRKFGATVIKNVRGAGWLVERG